MLYDSLAKSIAQQRLQPQFPYTLLALPFGFFFVVVGDSACFEFVLLFTNIYHLPICMGSFRQTTLCAKHKSDSSKVVHFAIISAKKFFFGIHKLITKIY